MTSLGQEGLIALMVVVGILFAGTLALSSWAIVMRSVHTAQERESRARTERWRDPVLGAVADPATVASVQALVEEDDAVPFLSFIIEYARRVRGEERAVLRSLASPFLPAMVERARSRRTEMRAWAVQSLGTLGLPEHEDVVLAALDDASPLVAMVAARALAREETPQYADAVLSRLDRFTGWNRLFLASMLAQMGPEVSASLRAGLADASGSPAKRAVMAEALRLEGDFAAGDVAAEALKTAGDRELVAALLRLLAAVGRPTHAALVRPLCASPDPIVRAQALHALGSLGGDEDVPLLVDAMDDADPWPALYAARGVRDAGGREALRRLVADGDRSASLAQQVLAEESPA